MNIGNINILMGPSTTGIGAPDDLLDAIVGFIDGANKYLDIAVQELDCMDIAEALVRARERGVRVRLVLEADYLVARRRRPAPFEPGGSHEPNRVIYDALLRAKSWVRSDFNPDIFHQKFIIRDRNSVLTGSTNFTNEGVGKNLNHIVIIQDTGVAKVYQREFDDIRRGRFGKYSQTPAVPPEIEVSGVRLKIAFAPDHNPEMEIMKQMLKAKRRIDFAIFTFARSSGIDDTMIARAEAGIVVRGLLNGLNANSSWAASKGLAEAGIVLRKVSRRKPLGQLHHKLMVLDERVVIIGSFNYTKPANLTNDENIVVIGDLGSTDPAMIANEEKIGAHALGEIDRIWDAHGSEL